MVSSLLTDRVRKTNVRMSACYERIFELHCI